MNKITNDPEIRMNKFAKILSWLFSPIVIPTYGVAIALWTTSLSGLSLEVKFNVLLMVFMLTAVLPALAILTLYKLKVISSPGLNQQQERTVPYVVTMVCYLGASFYLMTLHAPGWLTLFMVGGAGAAITSILVNHRWKISAHMAAMGGLTALTFRIASDHVAVEPMWGLLSVVILLTGMLGSARIMLGCHTLGQVLAGAANGFLWVFMLTAI